MKQVKILLSFFCIISLTFTASSSVLASERTLGSKSYPLKPNWQLGPNDLTELPKNLKKESATVHLVFGASSTLNKFQQKSSSEATVEYNMETPGSWSGFTVSFDNFDTPSIETADLSQIERLVLGVSDSHNNQSSIKVEFVDSNSNKHAVYLGEVTENSQFYEIHLSSIKEPIRKNIRYINFVTDPDLTRGKKGTLTLRTKGLYFVSSNPVIAPRQNLKTGDVTTLPKNDKGDKPKPILIFGANTSNNSLTQPTEDIVQVNYNVLKAGSWSGITIDYDDFGTPDIETANLLTVSRLIVGLKYSGKQPGYVRAEFIDSNNTREIFVFEKVSNAEHFFSLDLSLVSPKLRGDVRYINFVVNRELAGEPTGEMVLRLNGLES